MNTYVTGATIRQLRESRYMTQAELAKKIGVSSKAISKWETAKGLPDITLLQPLAQALGICVLELMNGEQVHNQIEYGRTVLSPGNTRLLFAFPFLLRYNNARRRKSHLRQQITRRFPELPRNDHNRRNRHVSLQHVFQPHRRHKKGFGYSGQCPVRRISANRS